MTEKRLYFCELDPNKDFCPVEDEKCHSFCEDCKEGLTYKEALEIGAYALAQQRYWEHADAIQMANSLGWKECERDAEIVIKALLKR